MAGQSNAPFAVPAPRARALSGKPRVSARARPVVTIPAVAIHPVAIPARATPSVATHAAGSATAQPSPLRVAPSPAAPSLSEPDTAAQGAGAPARAPAPDTKPSKTVKSAVVKVTIPLPKARAKLAPGVVPLSDPKAIEAARRMREAQGGAQAAMIPDVMGQRTSSAQAMGLFQSNVAPGRDADPLVPAGSSFEPWVWQALERDGRMLIEWHLDARMGEGPWNEIRRDYAKKVFEDPSAQRGEAGSVLVSVPMDSGGTSSPWPETLRRALLVPVQYTKALVPRKGGRRDHQGAEEEVDGVQRQLQDFYAFTPQPESIAHFAPRAGAQAALGRVALLLDGVNDPIHFWLIAPWRDVQALDAKLTEFERADYGRDGVREYRGADFDSPGPALTPTRRYLGVFGGERAQVAFATAQAALVAQGQAIAEHDPMAWACARLSCLPAGWTEEDVLAACPTEKTGMDLAPRDIPQVLTRERPR